MIFIFFIVSTLDILLASFFILFFIFISLIFAIDFITLPLA